MKKLFIPFTILITLACSIPGFSTPTPVVMSDSFFSGYAYLDRNQNGQLDETDTPLEGALISAQDARGLGTSALTDASGYAMIWWPGDSEYPVTIQARPPKDSPYTLIGVGQFTLQSNGTGGPAKFLFISGATTLPASLSATSTATAYLPVATIISAPPTGAPRPWPDTWRGIGVFNDQLSSVMSDELWQFSATHYAGTQKMTRSTADRLRSINPNFVILHYRLGHGLGYRAIENGCQPSGDWLLIIEGDEWAQEWPGDAQVQEDWFYHWPEGSSTRVLNCDWGWYLMELNDSGWQDHWQAEVLRQVQANHDDCLFIDSLSVPNYLGADRYDPHLPAVDETFENAWASRITNWLSWLQSQPIGAYYLVPNVGSWITTRETTDYSPADGLMIEGFAMEADQSPYALVDWQLQMDRLLAAIGRGQAILAQSYVMGDQERMFVLGSYLLVKGSATYLNIEYSMEPEWWPEYDLPLGAPVESATDNIDDLYDAASQVYRRDFENGFVLVNPTNPWDGSGTTITIDLGGTFYRALTQGGGIVPDNGVPTGTINYTTVTSITLPPFTAAVLFSQPP